MRALSIAVSGLALVGALLVSPLAGAAPSPDPHPGDKIAPATGAGGEAALRAARSLLSPKAPTAARRSVASNGSDATLVLRDLVRLRGTLSEGDRDTADALLARPADGPADPGGNGYSTAEAKPHCGPAVCVHYVTTTRDAVPAKDTDADGVPDQVERTLAALEHVHTTYVAAGYRAPKPDGLLGGDSRTDVYLADIGKRGLYGYCTTDEPIQPQIWDYWSYCVLDNDYSSREFPANTPAENLQVTAAHEYFHAIQFGYDLFEDSWFLEATATWAEDELFDDVNDSVQYLSASPLRRPDIPLDWFGNNHQYGAWSFFRFLTERHPDEEAGVPVLVREFWERADGAPGAPDEFSSQAVRSVLAARGVDLSHVFSLFGDANRRPARSYAEGRANDYPSAPLALSRKLKPGQSTGWLKGRMDHLTNQTIRLAPSPQLKARSWRLRLNVDLPPTARGSAATLTIGRRSGGVTTQPLTLSKRGDGTTRVQFSLRAVKYVEVTLTNASTRFDCWQGTDVSCGGIPLDERLRFRVRGTALR